MLAALLSRLPSVTTARDLAVAEERVRALADRVVSLEAERKELVARLNRLTDARLLREGAITSPALTDTPKPHGSPAPSLFGAFGRTVYDDGPTPRPLPVGADVDE